MNIRHLLLEQPYAKAFYQINKEGYVFIHVDVSNWSFSIYKALLNDMHHIGLAFKERGVDVLHSLIFSSNEQDLRFAELMGFEPVHDMENGQIHLEYRID